MRVFTARAAQARGIRRCGGRRHPGQHAGVPGRHGAAPGTAGDVDRRGSRDPRSGRRAVDSRPTSTGPGATEARAAHYIDRALGGALASSRDAYRNGLAALDEYARTSKGAPFARLTPANQDAVLTDLESNVATGFTPDAATFFNLMRAHTIQGTFCDPYYGGNASFVGWDLIGYPGIRLGVSAAEQQLDPRLSPTHRSAYDHAMFSKKRPARASVPRGHVHAG